MGKRREKSLVCIGEACGRPAGRSMPRGAEGAAAAERAERGSLTLEAAIVLPVFLTLVLAVLLMFRLSVIEMALQRTADNAVRQTAVALYPAGSWLLRAGGLVDNLNGAIGLDGLAEIAPEPVKGVVEALWSAGNGTSLVQPVLNRAFEPVVRHFVPKGLQGLVNPERVAVESVYLPYVHGEAPYFGLTVRYELKLYLPFYTRTIVLRKTAFERVWYGA